MSPELARLDAGLADSLKDLSAGQAQAAPPDRPESWNIQQIVEHLLLTYAGTCANIEARIAKGTATRASPSFFQQLAQFTVLRLRFFPHGRIAPAATVPNAPFPPRAGAGLALELHDALDRMDALLVRSQKAFGSRKAISHPILGPLSAPQWRTFHLVHGLHHRKQILAIRLAQRV